MGHHTFDADRAATLEDPEQRYSVLSAEELRWALDCAPTDTVVDLGSGTGFYTDDVAVDAGDVYAVDLQEAMHEFYREKGLPANVEVVTAPIDDMPFDTNSADRAFSTMTYHEFASEAAVTEIRRVIRPGGRLVVADWAAKGEGERGPPLAERYSLDEAVATLNQGGFDVEFEAARSETYLIVATRG
jgi:ubiquinone/menaquinone biosynthesis C-methylase UbiE